MYKILKGKGYKEIKSYGSTIVSSPQAKTTLRSQPASIGYKVVISIGFKLVNIDWLPPKLIISQMNHKGK